MRAVQEAIASERISIRPDGQIDPSQADDEWLRNTNPLKRPLTRDLDDLHPAIGSIYAIRGDLEKLVSALFRLEGPKPACRDALAALQTIPEHLRALEDWLAAEGIPLFDAGRRM